MASLRILIASALTCVLGTTVSIAGEVEEMIVLSNGAFVYSLSNGKEFRREYVSAGTLKRSDDRHEHLDDWGNKVKLTGESGVAFTPHNGQLPEEPMYVGLSWEHSYGVETSKSRYFRKKFCRVTDRGQIAVPVGTFGSAWKVECNNQRTDRELPKYETMWYSSKGRLLIHHKEWWEGSKLGSLTAELVSMATEHEGALVGVGTH